MVDRLCRVSGKPDLVSWLDLPPAFSPEQALNALERKRRSLERELADPKVASEAEVVFNHFSLLRQAIEALGHGDADLGPRAAADLDHYAVLGLQPTATFLAIERAYRHAKSTGNLTPEIEQAWRVLGDPTSRAAFDRRRRMGAVRTSPALHEAAPTSHDEEPSSSSGRLTVSIPGPEEREVHLEDDGPSIRTVVLVVRGPGAWRARIDVDHPCLSTRPARDLRVAEGRHTIAVRIDPAALSRAITSCTVTLTSSRETHTIAFRIHRASRRPWARPQVLGPLAGVVLLGVGWLFGQQTTVRMSEPTPASEGVISQVSAMEACFATGPQAGSPLPRWVDIHVDGLGRPIGFHIEGPTAPAAEACVRDALKRLEFPATKTGLPVFHRYHHARPGATP